MMGGLIVSGRSTGDLPLVYRNGASRSGLLCAVMYILERLLKDKEVDVFQAVKQMRLNRSQFIDTLVSRHVATHTHALFILF